MPGHCRPTCRRSPSAADVRRASGRAGFADTERGSRRNSARHGSNAAENRALLEAALRELTECRKALLELARKEEPVREPRRARAAGS